jgi:type III secretion system YscQ/HrcQ family protein
MHPTPPGNPGGARIGAPLLPVRRLGEAEAAARWLRPPGADRRPSDLRLRPRGTGQQDGSAVHGWLHCAGHSATLQLLSSDALDTDGIAPAELAALDDTLRQSLLQELLAPMTRAMAMALSAPVRLDTQQAPTVPSVDAEELDIELAGDAALAIRLCYPSPSAAVWRNCGGILADHRVRQALGRLPVACVLRFGRVALTRDECRSLVPGGALIIPRAADSDDALLCDRHGRRWARVRVEDQLIRVVEVLPMEQQSDRLVGTARTPTNLTETRSAPVPAERSAAAVAQVEVVVEASAETLSVDQLTQLAPGLLIGLTPQAARGMVVLRANGVPLARGRLVAVGESLAVYVDDLLVGEAA